MKAGRRVPGLIAIAVTVVIAVVVSPAMGGPSLGEIAKKKKKKVKVGPAGPQGPQGVPGPAGAPGSALGYAYVNGATNDPNQVDDAKSFRVTDGNVSHVSNGIYCFHGLPFTPKSITVTQSLVGATGAARTLGDIGDYMNCAVTSQAFVTSFSDIALTALINQPFYVVFN